MPFNQKFWITMAAQFPLDLAIKQSVLETASVIVLGITAAFVNRLLRHPDAGDMRCLTGAEDMANGLQLLQNRGEIERLTRFIGRLKFRWNTVYEDHSIARYWRKLGLNAASRQ